MSRILIVFTFCPLLAISQEFTVSGEIRSGNAAQLSSLEVELFDLQNHTLAERAYVASDGAFRFDRITAGAYLIRVKNDAGTLLEEYRQIDRSGPVLALQLPERAERRPISGIISIRELQHTPAKRAVRAAIEAQRFSSAGDSAKAIEKLEEAIRIDPLYRDAHTNLGAQYAHAGRIVEGLAEFRRALEIGPPDAIILSNLAWTCLVLRQPAEAEDYARKAVALDPANAKAQYLLGKAYAINNRHPLIK